MFESENKFEVIKRAITTDYDIFNKYSGNRQVSDKRVRAGIQKLRKNGWLPFFPLVVNENYEVIDGQARLEAARIIHCPVPYMVYKCVAGNDDALCADMNIANDNWKSADWIDFYADHEGLPDYIRLKDNLAKYEKELTFNVVLAILAGSSNSVKTSIIKNKRFFVHDGGEEELAEFYQLMKETGILEFCNKTKMSFRRNLFYGLRFAIKHTDCDIQELCKKIIKNDDVLNTKSKERTLESFDEIYNFKKAKAKKIYFYHTYLTLPEKESEEEAE